MVFVFVFAANCNSHLVIVFVNAMGAENAGQDIAGQDDDRQKCKE